MTHALNVQSDVMGSRQRARQIAEALGFNEREQTRIATSVSELARNAFRYAGGGKVEFELEGQSSPQLLVVRVTDEGPGIANLAEILEGTYRSTTGMGIGLIGSRRLMDRWEIHSSGHGTQVTIGKMLPDHARVITQRGAGELLAKLAALPQTTSVSEVQTQNAELLLTLADLQDKQDKLLELARELEDTNRGVVALYAELDEKAAHLRRADELKTRFLSNMSHEFRTPLNSMRALCALLLARADGPLEPEQEKQVGFIARAADDLSELVNDLLDLAKIEAGKIDVRPAHFEVSELFSALRGMLRPLLVAEAVELVFEDPVGLPTMYTDESKVSQIVRNFVSNALKFTERGSVRVLATLDDDGQNVVFAVSDTGIGIAMEDMELIFEEFAQVPNPLQRRVKGTGLGLPLCRRLATLLGGDVSVDSTPGRGSTFYARLPLRFVAAAQVPQPLPEATRVEDIAGAWVLAIEDDAALRLLYEKYFKGSGYTLVAVPTLDAAREVLRAARPSAVILDILLPGEEQHTWRWLAEEKARDSPLPVIVVSSVEDERKAYSLGADAYFAKPVARDALLAALERLTAKGAERLALIIDDDDAARYVIRKSLPGPMRFEEARDGASGLVLAGRCRPALIFLDLSMPGMGGDEVLVRLKADPATAHIPVIVVTSHDLDADLRARLEERAGAIVHKKNLSIEALQGALEAIDRAARRDLGAPQAAA
jgi:signal transduction histidine kinase/CheY-like chemotaxis protein